MMSVKESNHGWYFHHLREGSLLSLWPVIIKQWAQQNTCHTDKVWLDLLCIAFHSSVCMCAWYRTENVSSAQLLMSSVWKTSHMSVHQQILKEVVLNCAQSGTKIGHFVICNIQDGPKKINIFDTMCLCNHSRQNEMIFTKIFMEFLRIKIRVVVTKITLNCWKWHFTHTTRLS